MVVEEMTAVELLRKLKKLARARGIALTLEPGKGSHQKVQLGKKRMIVPMHGSELKTETLNGILKDLEIEKGDL